MDPLVEVAEQLGRHEGDAAEVPEAVQAGARDAVSLSRSLRDVDEAS